MTEARRTRPRSRTYVPTLALLALGASTLAGQAEDSSRAAYRADHLAMYERYRELPTSVGRIAVRQNGGHTVIPNWLPDGSRFWYADTRFSGRTPAHTTIYLVDPAANRVTELFDPERLRDAIQEATGEKPAAGGIPLRSFEFVGPGERLVRFELDDRAFELDLDTYAIRALEPEATSTQVARPDCDARSPSPDGRWIACARDHEVWLLSTDTDAAIRVTTDGSQAYGWRIAAPDGPSGSAWSPDGSHLAVHREDRREMPSIPLVRWLADPLEVEWIHDEPPAQPMFELHLYETDGGSLIPVDPDASPPAWWIGIIGWRPDGSELLYLWATDGGLREDIRAVDPETGAFRILHSEAAATPVYPGREWYSWMDGSELLLPGDRLLFLSEQSGSLQLYLKSLDGGEARQLTRGPGEVARIAGVDEERGWVYYTAFGDSERPYDVHFFRVALDGSGPARLTPARASHEPAGMLVNWFRRLRIHLSPSKGYFVARHSTMGRLPVTELRTTDGTLVRVLSEARLGPAAEEYRWQAPEEFVVKAADAVTDLWGVMWKPYDFDPSRRYPLIEVFYSGVVPRTFDAPGPYAVYAEKLAQLGFVTVMLEGRGSEGRGRGFRDAFAGRPGGFVEDHAAALRQLVAERPYLDGSRIGAYGYSAGGEEALWAAVGAPDTYRASVSVAPTEPASPDARESLLDGASNLDRPLLLVHGTADKAAPVRFTMRFLDASLQAGKPIDVLLVPDGSHGLGSAWNYAHDRVRDFFLEQLDP